MADGTFTISFSLRETLASLGLKAKEFDSETFDFAVSNEEIMGAMKEHNLSTDPNPEEEFGTVDDYLNFDYDQDVYYEVQSAISDAWQMGTEKRHNNGVENMIESTLANFANYGHVEYPCEGSHGVRHITADSVKGIEKYNVDMVEGKVSITFHRDMVHVINEMITCYGMFGIDCEEANFLANEAPLNEVQNYVKSHLHHLDTYWECYGDRKPGLEYDADFDMRYFDKQMQEIVQRNTKPT